MGGGGLGFEVCGAVGFWGFLGLVGSMAPDLVSKGVRQARVVSSVI